MTPLSEKCRNRWPSILPQLGIATSFLTGRQTPCPICGGRDRFRFDDKDGRGTYYCNQCGAGDGVELLKKFHKVDFKRVVAMIEPFIDAAPVVQKRELDADARIAALRSIWAQSEPALLTNDAGRYLVSRGIEPPFSDALRFVPRLKVTGESVPYLAAMIAVVRDPTGKAITMHRTYLQDGEKARITSPRRMMPGDLPKGSYIALSPPARVMGVAEGIETAIRASYRFNVPCWALISADNMRGFVPPPECKGLRIFGDNDTKFGGQAAAYDLAHRLATRPNPIDVRVEIPDHIGTDWADAA